jgi:hypothetical protein
MNDDTRVNAAGPEELYELLQSSSLGGAPCSDEDLAAVLDEYLNKAANFTLQDAGTTEIQVIKQQTEARGLLLKSLRDLLMHQHPPLQLLRETKEHAKRLRELPHGDTPHEVATAVYYTALAVGLLRCKIRLSSLSDTELAKGWRWLAKQVWVPPELRDAAMRAREQLSDTQRADEESIS